MMKLGKYCNSPPQKIIYYNTDDFENFINEYFSTILLAYNNILPPEISLEDGVFMIKFLNGETYTYVKCENKEIEDKTKDEII